MKTDEQLKEEEALTRIKKRFKELNTRYTKEDLIYMIIAVERDNTRRQDAEDFN